MTIGPEAQLMLLAGALYVYDSVVMLAPDEGVVGRGLRGWFARLGSSVDFRGKHLYLLNLLTPHRQIYRLRWNYENPDFPLTSDPVSLRPGLRVLAPGAWVVFVCLFALLPYALFTSHTVVTLGTIAVLYCALLLTASFLLFQGEALGLELERRRALAFECIVCPPMAINIVRKISLGMPLDESLVSASRRLLGKEDFANLALECISRLDEALHDEEAQTPRFERLNAARLSLIADSEAAA